MYKTTISLKDSENFYYVYTHTHTLYIYIYKYTLNIKISVSLPIVAANCDAVSAEWRPALCSAFPPVSNHREG